MSRTQSNNTESINGSFILVNISLLSVHLAFFPSIARQKSKITASYRLTYLVTRYTFLYYQEKQILLNLSGLFWCCKRILILLQNIQTVTINMLLFSSKVRRGIPWLT